MELCPIAAITGGIAAQEAIKVQQPSLVWTTVALVKTNSVRNLF